MEHFEKIRRFNLYYLAFVAFVVGYGRVFKFDWISFGKHPENILPIPIISSLYLAINEKGYMWPITFREKVSAIFALFISSGPFWGLYFEGSIDVLYEFWSAAVFAFLIMYNVRDGNELRLLVFSFLFGTLLKGPGSILTYISGQEVRASFTMGKNVYGNFLLIPISFVFGFMLYACEKFWKRIAVFFLFLFLGTVLFLTLSRTPLVAIALGIVLFMVIFKRKLAVLALASIILTISSLVVLVPDSKVSVHLKSIKWEDTNFQWRVLHNWPSAVNIYRDHNLIWGSGAGTYGQFIREDKYKNMVEGTPHPHAHNSFLQALVSYGAIGGAAYIFFIFQIAWLSWYVLKSVQEPFLKSIGCAGFVWIISSMVAAMTDHVYTSTRYNMSVAFIVCCVLISCYSIRRTEKVRD